MTSSVYGTLFLARLWAYPFEHLPLVALYRSPMCVATIANNVIDSRLVLAD